MRRRINWPAALLAAAAASAIVGCAEPPAQLPTTTPTPAVIVVTATPRATAAPALTTRPTPTHTPFLSVSTGYNYTCGVRTTGDVEC